MGCVVRWIVGVIAVSELTASDFGEFFKALWGYEPFAWQQDLANRVMEKDAWPEAIALPTAAGKTACMDIAVFALAAQASRLENNLPITMPRRVFFVVDRRVIVDQAYERASEMSEKLNDADEGVLKDVADRLRHIARGDEGCFEKESPLNAYMLRGGMYRSEGWARDPLQPMVVASTVDQVGSRLLFRPYGRNARSAPIYAGLVANDSLILLDEAHCAQPFMQTLHAVRKYRGWAHEPLGRSFYPVIMSATPPQVVSDVFTDTSSEKDDPSHPLGKRQLARKPATLKPPTTELSKELAKEALELVNEERRAIVVFVNRVAAARETAKILEETDKHDVVLLTGRMRQLDKEIVAERDLEGLHSGVERNFCKPKIVVATQTLEVGADLDFDGLVTECASLDALRQRFGRLNRMGRDIEARGVILIRSDQANPKRGDGPDPIYGEALKKTWEWLDEVKDARGEVDFGISHFDDLLSGAAQDTQLSFDVIRDTAEPVPVEDMNAPSEDAPIMLPAHVDCWGQTEPIPEPSPDVALFLHGPRESAADVQVCWRDDLDLSKDSKELSLESLKLCPPSSPEMLPVPIGVFKNWLSGTSSEDTTGDIEGYDRYSGDLLSFNSEERRNVVRWRGAEDTEIIYNPAEIRPGDVVVIPTDHPADHRLIGSFALKLDIGDQAHLKARAKPALRLHPDLVRAWPEQVETVKEPIRDLLRDLKQKDGDEVIESLREILTEIPADLPEPWVWLSDTAREFKRSDSYLRQSCHFVGGDQLILVGRRRVGKYMGGAVDIFSGEDDTASSGISHSNGNPVKLDHHLRGVSDFAYRYAQGCGLSKEMTDVVVRAGLLHDLGKANPRFQVWLRGGNQWSFDAADFEAYWAKSASRAVGASEVRHELYSVRLVENSVGLLPDNADLRDLVLHLIASHHGYCRPFAPVREDKECEASRFELDGCLMSYTGPTNLERLDSGVADRYWRLVRRYGWWGVAWLEAMVRLADWRRSEWEETHDEKE